ncbi:sigma-70 family RNA polymerase sigma factor [Gimesia chilikensis]|uniref:sigma-70 family RNA polymerase sigma factor n=1 Tax=Gimesia chilikensis TaxID=2605989 RepID=UPI001189FDDD|nr:sigma-70 family RNA polymerase sigma factor [Gimesia chilikensis]QDT85299.1 RNA polymerase sigma factor CarQ [Gimesia chilikensis]
MRNSEYQRLLNESLRGNQDAIGQLLDRHRPYLKFITQRALEGRLQARVDDSDIVQQTCLSALRNFQKFDGKEESQFVAWLQKIHERNIQDTIRKHVGAEKRTINNTVSVGAGDKLQGLFHLETLSPSQRVMQAEDAVRLAEVMTTIPEDQREAVRLRHLEGWSLAELEQHFGRSETAVASLIKRGLENLRKRLNGDA